MIKSVLNCTDTADDWPAIRADIRERVMASIGSPGPGRMPVPPQYEELETYARHGLKHVILRYHVIDDEWNKAIIVLPEDAGRPVPCVLAIHGTTQEGKSSMIDPENRPRRAYGIELARRGFVTCQYDLYGLGEYAYRMFDDREAPAFFKRYPDWSLDGRRLLDGQRMIDVLNTFDYIRKDSFGAIGNSLGGRSVMYLASLDERIKAAVSSTGISPNATNVFRSLKHDYTLSPHLNDAIIANGVAPWEYQEMIALIAPRALLALEPFNDSCNPDTFPTLECLYQASAVFRLLECPDRLAWYTHGDGHDTIDPVREFAYSWLERFLRAPAIQGSYRYSAADMAD